FIEKPDPSQITTNTINAGIYIIDRALLSRIDPSRPVSIEREFFPGLLADGVPVFGWVPDHYWLDIGSPAKYRQAQLDPMADKLAVGPALSASMRASEIPTGTGAVVTRPAVIGPGTHLGPGCRVGPDAVLGANCVIGTDAVVEGAILWDRVEVGNGAIVRDCIAATAVKIRANTVVAPGEGIPAA